MTVAERDELIDALLDGEISEADFLRLEGEMHVDSEVRQAYYSRLKLDTNLQIEAESRGGDGESKRSGRIRSAPANLSLGWLGWAAAAILALLAAVLGWKIQQANREESLRNEPEPLASGFGVVAEQSEAGWDLERGDFLPQGLLTLESGIARLDLFSGITLIVEGKAEFEVVSSMELLLRRGNFRLQVPEVARGFRVRTGMGEVSGIRQEFAISVTEEFADLHVIEGRAEWHPVAKPVQRLGSGDSLRWSASGRELEGAGSIAGVGELENRISTQRDERRARWQAHSEELRRDPRLLAYFPMDQAGNWNRQLIDESGSKRNGTIVRAARAADRWGDSHGGLDFSSAGSRVRVEIPGDHQSLTLMCWVRIDSLDRWYNSLFLTDGHELHEPHWQIMDDGRLFFSVKAHGARKKGKDKHVAYSPSIWNPAQSGKWMHIATVFDGKAMTSTHYVNGEVISRDEIPADMHPEKVRIGAASIGNWSDPTRGDDPHFAVRNLNGTIDEFAIFSEPLPEEEVREIYEIGKP